VLKKFFCLLVLRALVEQQGWDSGQKSGQLQSAMKEEMHKIIL